MRRPGMMRERGMRDPQERRHGRGFFAQGRRHRGDGPPEPESRGGWRGGRERHERGGPEERHHGRPGPRGWRGPGGPRVGRGDVRAATLMLLAEQPLHGYELIQRITERSGGAWRPSPGSVYPALQLLEDQGLIRGEQTEGRRVYHLTEAGSAHIEQHRADLAGTWAGVTAAGDDPSRALRDLFEQLGGAVRQVVHAGTETQVAAARDVLTNARRQLYRILADDPGENTPSDPAQS
ncbi:MAG TPA: PadR family transcriptional regulator [Herpetosiphonaceae bacterium]